MPGYRFTISPGVPTEVGDNIPPSVTIIVNTGDASYKDFKKWLEREKGNIAQALIDQQPS